MTNIDIKVTGAHASTVRQTGILTTGMVGATVTFTFDSEWAGLSKTAVFWGSGVTKDVVGIGDLVKIPPEVLKREGQLWVGVVGLDADDDVVLPTIWAGHYTVKRGADPSGDTSTDPSLPVWGQIQESIGDLAKLGTVDKSSLVAAVNEVLSKGGGTVDEATVERLVEEYLVENPPMVTETDPTVPDWAKQSTKPGYTAEEVGALPNTTKIPSTAEDVGALPATTFIPKTAADVGAIPVPDTAAVGQTMVVTEVDEDGKVVSWECVDVPSAGGSSETWKLLHDAELTESVSSLAVSFADTPCKKIRVQLHTIAIASNAVTSNITIGTETSGSTTYRSVAETLSPIPLTSDRITLINAEMSQTDSGNTLEVEAILCGANGLGNSGANYKKTVYNNAKGTYKNAFNSTITVIKLFTSKTFDAGTKIKIWGC